MFYPQGSNWQYYRIGSDNGLVPTRRQAIIWTKDGIVYWRIYASHGLDELTLLMLKPEDRSIPWLLLPWLVASPGHQQSWYSLFMINGFLSTRSNLWWRRFTTTRIVPLARNDRNCKYIFHVFSKWLSTMVIRFKAYMVISYTEWEANTGNPLRSVLSKYNGLNLMFNKHISAEVHWCACALWDFTDERSKW